MGLGEIFELQGKRDQAIGEYRTACKLRPNSALAHNYIAWAMVKKPDCSVQERSEALEHARRAVLLDPKDGDFRATLALAEYRAGHWAESIALTPPISGPCSRPSSRRLIPPPARPRSRPSWCRGSGPAGRRAGTPPGTELSGRRPQGMADLHAHRLRRQGSALPRLHPQGVRPGPEASGDRAVAWGSQPGQPTAGGGVDPVVKANGNRIDVTARAVARYTLLIRRDMFDLDRPIQAFTNGALSFNARVKPDLDFMLEQAGEDDDRSAVYSAKIEIQVLPGRGPRASLSAGERRELNGLA